MRSSKKRSWLKQLSPSSRACRRGDFRSSPNFSINLPLNPLRVTKPHPRLQRPRVASDETIPCSTDESSAPAEDCDFGGSSPVSIHSRVFLRLLTERRSTE